MKFKRTSYLTRLAALGVAAATFLVPLAETPAALANESATQQNMRKNQQLNQTSYSAAKNSAAKKFDAASLNKNISPDELHRINPTLAKALEKYAQSNSNKNNASAKDAYETSTSSKPITVIVTLKNNRPQHTKANEKANLQDQNAFINRVKSKYNMKVRRQLGYLMNAFEANLPEEHIKNLRREPGVVSVEKERLYYPMENTARNMQGVLAAFKKHNLDGTGMLVSIIDTGIDPTHQDMKLDASAKSYLRLKPTGTGHTTEKIPAGFNYADENEDFTDRGPEQHGMHVAGIVAANGDENGAPASENHRVDGVAPNAQLLAMKVFSNNPEVRGARDVDIVAAIEDSVKFGADVINMSLGSDNGLGNTSNATSFALKKALEAGSLPVISAGNSGLNFSPSGGEDDVMGKWDDATLGSPSSYPSAFSVASVENSNITQKAANWTGSKDSKSHSMPYSYSIGNLTDALTEHEIVDAKKATKDDVKDLDLIGKYALVERGGITFTDKFNNAIAKGAKGVVVYNHDKDSSMFLGMGGLEKIKNCFGASIPRANALQILAALKKGETVKISFTDQFTTIVNPDNSKPSTFTSWGPTPELDFKPHIAGIGGNVWSTQNGNTYTSMSGTSMAAPNISGLSALVMESYKKRFPKPSPKDRATRVVQALMNTSSILKNESGVPYAPRQIGAGLAQVDKAIEANVIATVDGNPYVALREVNSEHKFTVNLHNYGKKQAKFSVLENQVVVNESNEAGAKTVTSVSETETLQSKTREVVVKPGKDAKVTFTLRPDRSKGDHYIEGWVQFESLSQDHPNLSVPYLGFVGDWNAEPIMVKPGEKYGAGHDDLTTSLLSPAGFMGKVPVNKEATPWVIGEFSPATKDGWMDYVVPSMAMFRGATDIKYSILDSKNKTKVVLGSEHNIIRSTLANAGATDGLAGMFDGSNWNPENTLFEILPDGWYTYRIEARLSNKFDWQTYDMKIAIDNHGPKVTVSDRDKNGDVTITVSDALSPDPGVPTIHLPGSKDALSYGDEDAHCPLNVATRTRVCKPIHIGTEAQYIDVLARDNAMNPTSIKKVFKNYTEKDKNGKETVKGNKKFIIPNEKDLTTHQIKANAVEKDKNDSDKNGKFYLEGYLADDVASIKAYVTPEGGKEQKVAIAKKVDGKNLFYTYLPLKNGKNTVTLKAFDTKGTRIGNKKLVLTFNEQAPNVTLNGLDDKGNVPVSEDGKVTITGKVTDTPGDTVKLKLKYQKAADNTTSANVVGNVAAGKATADKVAIGKIAAKSAAKSDAKSAGSAAAKAVSGANTTSKDTISANVRSVNAAAADKETEEVVPVGKDGSFKTVIKPAAKAVTVTLVATDSAENTTTMGLALAGRASSAPEDPNTKDFVLTNAGSMGPYSWLVRGRGNGPDVIGKDYFVAKGEVKKNVTSVVFTPETRFDAKLKKYAPSAKPLRANLKDGKFSVKLPMHSGINDFRLQVNVKDNDPDADEDDELNILDTPAAFYFDVTAPTARFDTPKLYGHTLFTNRDTVTFNGNVSDDSFGQSLRINNQTVGDYYTLDTNGSEVTRQKFSTEVAVNNNDKLMLQLSDQLESNLLAVIPVVLDETDPTVQAGLLEGEEITDGREITVRAKDDNLKSLRVLVDGKPVAYTENYLPVNSIESAFVEPKNVNDHPEPNKPDSKTLTLKIPTDKLADGAHTITVEATDFAGNTASDTSENSDGGTAYTFTVKHGKKVEKVEKGEGEPGSSKGEPDKGKSGKKDASTQTEPVKSGKPSKPGNPGKKDGSTQTEPEPTKHGKPSKPGKKDAGTQTEPVKPTTPTAPDSSAGIASSLAQLSTTQVDAGESQSVYVVGNPAGLKNVTESTRMYAFIYSEPQQLKGDDGNDYVTVRKAKNGTYYFNAMIPADLTGEHTILLMSAAGEQIAAGKVTVRAAGGADTAAGTSTQAGDQTANPEPVTKNNDSDQPDSKQTVNNNESDSNDKPNSHAANGNPKRKNLGSRSFTKHGKRGGSSSEDSTAKSDSENASEAAANGGVNAGESSDGSSGEAGLAASDANSAQDSEHAAERAAAKALTSKLAVTGSSIIAAVATFAVLVVSGLMTFTTRRRHAYSDK